MRAGRLWPALVPTLALLLAGCALPARPGLPASAPAPAVPMPTPRPGAGRTPADQLLLTAAALPGHHQFVGPAGLDAEPGPGQSSAASRFTSGSGDGQRRLYLRVSRFAGVGAAGAEYNAEQGDIGRSSTALPSAGIALGEARLAYRVDSGAGASATSSVGLLVRERNYLCNAVLTGPSGAVQLADLLPLAQRQVAALATAR